MSYFQHGFSNKLLIYRSLAMCAVALYFSGEGSASHIDDLSTGTETVWDIMNDYGSKIAIGGGTLIGGFGAFKAAGFIAGASILALGFGFLMFWDKLAG